MNSNTIKKPKKRIPQRPPCYACGKRKQQKEQSAANVARKERQEDRLEWARSLHKQED